MVTALYVEDNPDNVRIVQRILGAVGYEVMIAKEGREALDLLDKLHPDFILMDYHLPGMNGVEATRQLKNNPALADIPVIALTADIYSQNTFMEAGCDIYLTKPIRRATLMRTIHQVLGVSYA